MVPLCPDVERRLSRWARGQRLARLGRWGCQEPGRAQIARGSSLRVQDSWDRCRHNYCGLPPVPRDGAAVSVVRRALAAYSSSGRQKERAL